MLLGKDKSKLFHVSLGNVVCPKGISLSQPYCPLVARIVLSVCKDTISFIFSVTYIFSFIFCLSLPFKKVFINFFLKLLVIYPEKMQDFFIDKVELRHLVLLIWHFNH